MLPQVHTPAAGRGLQLKVAAMNVEILFAYLLSALLVITAAGSGLLLSRGRYMTASLCVLVCLFLLFNFSDLISHTIRPHAAKARNPFTDSFFLSLLIGVAFWCIGFTLKSIRAIFRFFSRWFLWSAGAFVIVMMMNVGLGGPLSSKLSMWLLIVFSILFGFLIAYTQGVFAKAR